MTIRGHQPVTISAFNGLFLRDGADSTPLDHFTDGLNFQVTEGGVDVRDGFSLVTTLAGIVRTYVYKIYGQADRYLILDNTGKLWDSTNLGSPILNIATMTDFAFVNVSGRAYISPTNGTTGLAGESLYVYTGSGVARLAAGTAPTGVNFTAINSATVGNVEAGFHLFMAVFETSSGFLTAPGPAIFASLTATGGLAVNLSNIPVGGANVSFVHILATKIIQNYNGNQNGYQPFFIPNAKYANGTTTATVSFFDADLLTGGDATYLFDLYSTIPAMLWLTTYHGRLIGGGENANPSVVRVAEAGQPEAINQLTGLLLIDPANTSSPVTNGQEYRDLFYLFKSTRTYGTNDNNGDPSTWQVNNLDEGIGTYPHGIGTVLDTGGVSIDKIFIVDHSGYQLFSGSYIGPQSLSWKIQDFWKRINPTYFYKIQTAVDPIAKQAYIAVPLDAATEPSHIFVMDYKNASGYPFEWFQTVRWMIWTLPNKPTTIVCHDDGTTPNVLNVGSSDGNIYKQVINQTSDYGNAIPTPYIKTSLVPAGEDVSQIHFAGAQLRVVGSGTLSLTFFSYDNSLSSALQSLTLSATPGIQPFALGNFNAQKATLKIAMSTINNYFKINQIKIYVKETFKQLPN